MALVKFEIILNSLAWKFQVATQREFENGCLTCWKGRTYYFLKLDGIVIDWIPLIIVSVIQGWPDHKWLQ